MLPPPSPPTQRCYIIGQEKLLNKIREKGGNMKGKGSVPEPEPQGAATFAGAVTLIQFLAPAPCYKLGILK
jgi:hypothetical protein